MKKYALFLLAAASLNAFASCNDDDDRHESNPQWNGVSEMVVKTFNEMYPDAKNIEWEVRNGYAVAEFYTASGAKGDDENTKAWFDNQLGDWAMTESDVTSANIPQAVLAAFGASEYADWRIDDIDMVLRNGMELVYVLEVEQGERDIDLYYSEDGVLVKSIAGSVNNDYSDFIPQQPTGSVTDWIASNYPDARVVDIDVEDGGTEVEILDGSELREVLFNYSGSWVYTKTEMRWNRLPSAITQVFQSSDYRDYHIDDIDFYQTESGSFYRFDLESRDGDIKIDIATDGQITPASPVIGTNPDPNPGTTGTPGMIGSDYQSFIESTYPGARILERDYDDGYLEIEIWHDGREKKVYFDGSENWVFTKCDYRYGELPEAVKVAISGSQFAQYHVDDVEMIESQSGTWFTLELERGDRDVTVRIDANGTIL